jgi:hypothetical protein
MKLIEVRFGNLKCSLCGKEIQVGGKAWYHNSTKVKLVFCVECGGDNVGQAVRSWMLARLAEKALKIAEAADLLQHARQNRTVPSDTISELERHLQKDASLVETTTEKLHQLPTWELVEKVDTFVWNLSHIDTAEEVFRWCRK